MKMDMKKHPKQRWLEEEAKTLFKQTVLDELYGLHLFATQPLADRDYYLFRRDEKGDAVWLLQRDSRKQEYETLRVEETEKLATRRVMPSICKFWHNVYIPLTWLAARDYGIEDIKKKVIEEGRDFAQRINQQFVDVLMVSVESRVLAQKNIRLDDTLAQISDELSKAGFSADRLLFPKGFLHRLVQQGIITKDDEVQNNHYVGKTNTGLYGFWSGELPEDTVLIFDSAEGVTITIDPTLRPALWNADERDSIGVGGMVYLNPIVKNTRSVIAIEGIGQVIDLTPSQISSVPATPADEPAVIDEIRSNLNGLRFLKATKAHVLADFEDVARTYQNEAYKACVVMCGAVMEGLLLGNLERAKNIKLLWNADRLTGFVTYDDARNKLREVSLEDLINHTRKSNCIDGFTDEVARMVQRCRNSIHPGRVLRGDEVLDAFDKKAADLALSFLNVLCSLIAKS
jgi:hypothetical protein